MINAIQKLTEDMRGKVRLMIGRAILSAISDAGAVQTVQAQLLADETHDDMERIQEYGFTSVPLPGAEGVAVFVGGNRDHGLIIATEDRRYRLKGLQGGEVALYDDQGQVVILHRDGIRLTSPKTIRVDGKEVHIHAQDRLRFDVNGYGEDWVHASGAWHVDTWKIGNVVAGSSHNISPPEHA